MPFLDRLDALPANDAGRTTLFFGALHADWRTLFAELREARPVLELPGLVVLSRWADVVDMLSRNATFRIPYRPHMDPSVGPFMMGRDDTELNWRDKSVMRTLLRWDDLPGIRALSAEVAASGLAAGAAGGTVDVVATVSRLVPLRVVQRCFGFPGPDDATMLRWSRATQADMFHNLGNDPAVLAACIAAGMEMRAWLRGFLAARQPWAEAGGDDTVSRLLRLHASAITGMDAEAVVTNVCGLLVGAIETTSQAIVNATEQILRDDALRTPRGRRRPGRGPGRSRPDRVGGAALQPDGADGGPRRRGGERGRTRKPARTRRGTGAGGRGRDRLGDVRPGRLPRSRRLPRPAAAELSAHRLRRARMPRRLRRRRDGAGDDPPDPAPARRGPAARRRQPDRGRGRAVRGALRGGDIDGHRRVNRDTSRDGWRNVVEDRLLSGLRPFWAWVNRTPWLARRLNGLVVDNAVRKLPARPLALSTMHDHYTSWPSLTDRTFFSRYLPGATPAALPDLAGLFTVRASGPHLSPRSTLLFPAFAQWFTDGFLMTEPNRRKTRTNHQIDLGQLYGPTAAATAALRLRNPPKGRLGRLLTTPDGLWAPPLYAADGSKPEALPDPVHLPSDWPAAKRATIFAFGGERANSTCYTAAITTLFLREHNRLCAMLEANDPTWDDDRVFETARNINIVLLLRIVVQEYINHISPYWLQLLADPAPAYRAAWNRPNWIPVEFNLLYRWHSLVPAEVRWGEQAVPIGACQFDHARLLAEGLAATLASASDTQAWKLGLFNSIPALEAVEMASVRQGRDNALASYNDYRANAGYPRVTRFEQISGDPDVVAALSRLYGDVDRVEFFVGLLAEDLPPRSAVPPLIGRMVAADAFSHALTNPLLAPLVYTEATFTRAGLAEIAATNSLSDLVGRTCPETGPDRRVTMEWGAYRSSA